MKLVQFYALKAGEPLSSEEAKRRIRPKRLKKLHEPHCSGREAAYVLALSPDQLYALVASGELPAERERGEDGRAHLKIKSSDVRAIAERL